MHRTRLVSGHVTQVSAPLLWPHQALGASPILYHATDLSHLEIGRSRILPSPDYKVYEVEFLCLASGVWTSQVDSRGQEPCCDPRPSKTWTLVSNGSL